MNKPDFAKFYRYGELTDLLQAFEKELATRLQDALGLSIPPIAICFTEAAPQNVPVYQ